LFFCRHYAVALLLFAAQGQLGANILAHRLNALRDFLRHLDVSSDGNKLPCQFITEFIADLNDIIYSE